jgi:hypothetical protein
MNGCLANGNALWLITMKKRDRSSGRRKGSAKSSQGKLRKPTLHDVETIDTRKCLSMLRRIVRKSALPEVPEYPWGPFLN